MNPHDPRSTDFKSAASAYSAIPPYTRHELCAKNRNRTDNLNVEGLCPTFGLFSLLAKFAECAFSYIIIISYFFIKINFFQLFCICIYNYQAFRIDNLASKETCNTRLCGDYRPSRKIYVSFWKVFALSLLFPKGQKPL